MKKDKHLNVFWQYNGNPHYEDNITKALFNTIDSYDVNTQIEVIKNLFGVDVKGSNLKLEFYLQTKPADEIIDSLNTENKTLIAFSPTGKCWADINSLNHDESLARKSIEVSLKKFIDDNNKLKMEVDAYFKKTKAIIENRGGSVPDGWMVIKNGDKTVHIIVFENKLYDLDPYQLKNHCDKSLKISIDSIKFLKYKKIINLISERTDYMSKQFTEYMFYLGYWEIDNLSNLPKNYEKEQTKYLVDKRVIQLLNELSNNGGATKHGNWMWKIDTGNDFCKMIGLNYDEKSESIALHLYFFSTQNNSKKYYKEFYEKHPVKLESQGFFNSFHFQHVGIGKNIIESYYENNHPMATGYIEKDFNLNNYMSFWYKNTVLLKQSTKEECLILVEKMKNENLINNDYYCFLKSFIKNCEKPVNVVPEIGCIKSITIDEAIRMDKDGLLVNYLKEAITEVYKVFDFNVDFLK